MKNITDFSYLVNDLCSIGDCPNFSDEMRDKARELLHYIVGARETKREKEILQYIAIKDKEGIKEGGITPCIGCVFKERAYCEDMLDYVTSLGLPHCCEGFTYRLKEEKVL